jgi:hypothetical protein
MTRAERKLFLKPRMSCGVRQIIDPNDADRVLDVIRNFTFDMDHLIFKNPKYKAVKMTCKNRHPECSMWGPVASAKPLSRFKLLYLDQPPIL